MKLGIINGWEEGHFRTVSEMGLDAIEFCVNHNYDSAEVLAKAEQIKSYSEKYNVAVGSVGRWGMDRIDENGEVIPEALAHDRNLVDFCSIVGCPVFNVGVNYTEKFSFYENCMIAVRYLGGLIEYARPKNVKIAVYNCSWSNFIYEEKAWSVVLGALPELGIKYDASHCCNRKGNYIRELRDWGSRVYHVHLKGVLRCDEDGIDDPPAGLDMINWGALFALLYINDFDGTVSIEPHSRVWSGAKGRWGVEFTIAYMRKYVMPESYKNMIVEDPYMP